MVRRCCIATCRNSNRECGDERVSFFKVPSAPELLDKWLQAVIPTGSSLHKNSSICERHFAQDQIKREALTRDSYGNVIFQRPLIKCSLIKEAVPTIFHKDIEVNPKTRRKRKLPPLGLQNDSNSVDSVLQSNTNLSCGSIIVSFHEDQTSSVQYITNEPQALPTVANAPAATSHSLNGIPTIFSNNISNGNLVNNGGENCQIQIYINPQEVNGSNVNRVENNSGNSSLVNENQVLQPIPNLNGPNAQVTEEVTIIIPDDEANGLNAQQKKARRKKSKKNTMQPQQPLPESETHRNMREFDLIYHNVHNVKLPNDMWGYHKNPMDKNIIIFSKVKWFKSDVLIPPIYEKQVIFHETDKLMIYINNKFSPREVRRPKDVAEMEQILKFVDELKICSAGLSIDECNYGHCAQKDYAVGRWRHKLCPVVVANDETTCKFCSSINQALRYPKKKKLPFGRRQPVQQTQQGENSS